MHVRFEDIFGDDCERSFDAKSHRNRDGKQIGIKKDSEGLAALDFGGWNICISGMREAGFNAVGIP